MRVRVRVRVRRHKKYTPSMRSTGKQRYHPQPTLVMLFLAGVDASWKRWRERAFLGGSSLLSRVMVVVVVVLVDVVEIFVIAVEIVVVVIAIASMDLCRISTGNIKEKHQGRMLRCSVVTEIRFRRGAWTCVSLDQKFHATSITTLHERLIDYYQPPTDQPQTENLAAMQSGNVPKPPPPVNCLQPKMTGIRGSATSRCAPAADPKIAALACITTTTYYWRIYT